MRACSPAFGVMPKTAYILSLGSEVLQCRVSWRNCSSVLGLFTVDSQSGNCIALFVPKVDARGLESWLKHTSGFYPASKIDGTIEDYRT